MHVSHSLNSRQPIVSSHSKIKGAGGVNPFYKKGTTDFSESAYKKTQPKPILDYSNDDDDDDKK